MAAPESDGSVAVDGVKAPASNPGLKGVDGTTHPRGLPSASEMKSGVDGMAFPDGVGAEHGPPSIDQGKPNEATATLTNGIAEHSGL